MDIGERVEIIGEVYKDTIKPNIQTGRIKSAYEDIFDLSLALLSQLNDFAQFHSGISFVASACNLSDSLKRDNEVSYNHDMGWFEAYLAQIRLAIESGNKF
ncbi:hypothetical protein CMO89_00290 [Candidatus Woesearchaeota archaeon]|nr:hypothetical protein [Candidatus Woesearchaeota archaeon]|tara:strand:+ start:436 stop:738 length:303 start_codon:yes stop_codon:yes gene_type:complete